MSLKMFEELVLVCFPASFMVYGCSIFKYIFIPLPLQVMPLHGKLSSCYCIKDKAIAVQLKLVQVIPLLPYLYKGGAGIESKHNCFAIMILLLH